MPRVPAVRRSIAGVDDTFYRRWREVTALARTSILDDGADVAEVLAEVAAWCAFCDRFYQLRNFVRSDFAHLQRK